MIRRGMSTLNELDAAEAKEKEDELAHAQAIPLPLSSDEVPFDPAFLSESFWGDLGFDGGIPQASQGN